MRRGPVIPCAQLAAPHGSTLLYSVTDRVGNFNGCFRMEAKSAPCPPRAVALQMCAIVFDKDEHRIGLAPLAGTIYKEV